MVLSMLATPFIVMYSNRIVMKLVSSEWLQQSLADDDDCPQVHQCEQACDHLWLWTLWAEPGPHPGPGGHSLYGPLDLDPDRVRQAAAAGDSVVFGDAARLQALIAAGLARASAVVVTYIDVGGRHEGAGAHPWPHAPQVPVIVRTQG
jgi:CPA2 family monovalent cation:H+ antiporter-2